MCYPISPPPPPRLHHYFPTPSLSESIQTRNCKASVSAADNIAPSNRANWPRPASLHWLLRHVQSTDKNHPRQNPLIYTWQTISSYSVSKNIKSHCLLTFLTIFPHSARVRDRVSDVGINCIFDCGRPWVWRPLPMTKFGLIPFWTTGTAPPQTLSLVGPSLHFTPQVPPHIQILATPLFRATATSPARKRRKHGSSSKKTLKKARAKCSVNSVAWCMGAYLVGVRQSLILQRQIDGQTDRQTRGWLITLH